MPESRDRQPRFSFGVNPDARLAVPRRGGRNRNVLVAVAILALLVAAGTYLYFYQPTYVRAVLDKTPFPLPATITHAYKWQGADGTWHISDDPPTGNIVYQKITVRSDTNIVPATPTVKTLPVSK